MTPLPAPLSWVGMKMAKNSAMAPPFISFSMLMWPRVILQGHFSFRAGDALAHGVAMGVDETHFHNLVHLSMINNMEH